MENALEQPLIFVTLYAITVFVLPLPKKSHVNSFFLETALVKMYHSPVAPNATLRVH